jgi:tRNA threonylcarbamoyladenosine biosynthesis protein TsaB
MKILGIDTSTDVCSVAIFDEDKILAHRDSKRDFSHAAMLHNFIESCVKEAGINYNQLVAIAVASGPGSYTGLRVGASTAKGLCYGLDLPLIAIDTMTSLAYSAENLEMDSNTLIVPMLDARREEVYTAIFDHKFNMLQTIQKMVIDQAFFEMHENHQLLLCGNGVEKFLGKYDTKRCSFIGKDSSASFLFRPAVQAFLDEKFENIDDFSPFYLNNPNITASKKNIFH